MRIISIRVAPVAQTLGMVYAAFGFIAWVQYAFGRGQKMILPFGVVAPLFDLNLNIHLERSTGVFHNLFLCIASILLYAATGLLTGALGALCFYLIAKHIGGVDAKYFSLAKGIPEDRPTAIAIPKDLEAKS
jgi:hypothetical protein